MIYLIQYNRSKGRLVTFESFATAQRTYAETARLELELELRRRDINHEVVLLEAADENALRKTHRRYFEDLSEIVKSLAMAFRR